MLFFHKNKRQFGIRSHRNLFVALFLFLVFGVSGVISFILNARAADVPIPFVEIMSNHSSYPDIEPGSWKVTKSAKWISTNKARITFEVNSVAKYNGNGNYDVVLVIDNSGSMEGAKINQVIADATDLTNTLLSDPANKVALIAFSTEATVLSGFTNNRTRLTEIINGIAIDGMTNYYDGLLKAGDILEGYEKKDGRELVLLFLTDGLPNEGTPNQVSQYRLLKQKYPFMTINGIQYEMGEEVLEPIIEISDYQYIANIDSLNNVLFTSTISPYIYEDFILTDYINDEYWTVSGLTALNASLGETNLEYNGDTPVITWDLSNYYRSGGIATLTIDINLKDNYIDLPEDNNLLLPTNTHEIIQTKLLDTPDEDVDEPQTPILTSNYAVIYDANLPTGCEVEGAIPATTKHTVFTIVEMQNNKLSCSGYSFKGWKISTPGVDRINNDYFRMPEKDVYIKAIWTKPSISKSAGGTTHVKAAATFDTGQNVNIKMKKLSGQSTATFTTANTTITTFARTDTMPNEIDTNDDRYILSAPDSALPIYGWYDNGIIYFYTNAEIACLNPNSSYMFYQMQSLSHINGSDIITSQVTDMSYMFNYVGYRIQAFDINLSSWDTSNVTNMGGMFSEAGGNSQTFSLNLLGWDTSKVTNMGGMFSDAGYASTTWSIEGISDFNTSNVTNMQSMFAGSGASLQSFSIDLSSWDTSNVTNMIDMFNSTGYNSQSFNLNLSGWDTSNVTSMSVMFNRTGYSATTWSIDGVSGWNTSKVTDMYQMFNEAGYNAQVFSFDLSGWNTANVTDNHRMFYFAGYNSQTFNLNLSNWDISNITDINHLFSSAGYNSQTFNLNLSNWNASNAISMLNVFNNAGYNSRTFSLNLSGWKTSSAETMSYMFDGAGFRATTWSIDGLSGWDVSNVMNMSYMFHNAGCMSQMISLDLSSWDTSKVKDMNSMFNSTGSNTKTFSLNLSNWNTANVTNMNNMFFTAGQMATSSFIIDGLSNWNTANVTNMRGMFFTAGQNATNWSIGDLSNWNTANVTNMGQMFTSAGKNATNWSIGDLSNWNTANVTNMSQMFTSAGYSSQAFILNLSDWNISNVTDINNMFSNSGYNAATWSIGDLSDWNTAKVTNMESLFSNAGHKSTMWSVGNLSDWDTSKVTKMSYIFNAAGYSAQSFDINLSNWNTSNVTAMTSMFSKAGYSAATWSVIIPANNGASIANTTSKIYGKTTSVSATPDSGKQFTLAP